MTLMITKSDGFCRIIRTQYHYGISQFLLFYVYINNDFDPPPPPPSTLL